MLRNGSISVRVRATETLAFAGRAAAPNTPTISSRLDELQQRRRPSAATDAGLLLLVHSDHLVEVARTGAHARNPVALLARV